MAFLDGIIPPYYESILITVGIYIILALGLNLITGVTGQLNLGHAAYMSIGAYTSAMISLKLGLPFIFAILAGGCAAAFFGVVIGYPTLRLTGDYLAICTLGFGEILKSVFKKYLYHTRSKSTCVVCGFSSSTEPEAPLAPDHT